MLSSLYRLAKGMAQSRNQRRLETAIADTPHLITSTVRDMVAGNPEFVQSLMGADETLFAHAMNTFLMNAAGDMGDRITTPWPILNQVGRRGQGTQLGHTLPKVSPFNLRRFSEYPLPRRAINVLKNAVLDMPWAVEVISPKTESTKGFGIQAIEPTKEQLFKIGIAENTLERPNNDDTWRMLAEQLLEDIIVGGFGALEFQRTNNWLRPAVLYPVDGMSIRINPDWQGDSNIFRYEQSFGYSGQTVSTGQNIKLMDEELIYMRFQSRTNTPFGLGYLETAYVVVNAWLGAIEFAERRASNSTPSFAIFLGENADIPTVRRWQEYWEQYVEGNGKVPILGGGRQPEIMKFSDGGTDPLWLGWQEMLIRYVAQAFGITPMKLALERDVNRSTAKEQDADDWDTVAPVANTIADYLTHGLIHKRLGFTDLQFRWIIRDTDEKRQSEIMNERWEMSSVTINEVRHIFNQPPLETVMGNMTRLEIEAYLAQQSMAPQTPDVGGPPLGDSEDEIDQDLQSIQNMLTLLEGVP